MNLTLQFSGDSKGDNIDNLPLMLHYYKSFKMQVRYKIKKYVLIMSHQTGF